MADAPSKERPKAVSKRAQLPITGYLDRLSGRPGEIIEAKISVLSGGRCRARLVRVISADANPKGPGMRYEDLSHRFDQWFEGRLQPILLGSWAQAPGPTLDHCLPYSWTAIVSPSLEQDEYRTVMHHAGATA